MKKRTDFYTVVLFLALIVGLSLSFWLLPDNDFSPIENRGLQALPKCDTQSLLNGDFVSRVNDYFADQFPLRDGLVSLKARTELALGKHENDGILQGNDGQLARCLFDIRLADGQYLEDVDCFDAEHVQRSCDALTRVESTLDIPFRILLTGRTVDVCASSFDYPRDASDALLDAVREGLTESQSVVDTIPTLREQHDNGAYVYYKTDHHWTTRGAYFAYVALMESLGMEDAVIPESAFEKQTVSDDFYGTAWSAGGMRDVAPDEIEIWSLGNESEFSVVADGREIGGFYAWEYLSTKDQYSFFLDGTHDVVTVTKKDGESRPRLLILKDSFANAMVPFLAQHFDLVLLNLSSTRTDYTNLTARVADYDADCAVLIYTLENMITADRLSRLH